MQVIRVCPSCIELEAIMPEQPPSASEYNSGAANFHVQIMLYEVRNGVVWFLVRKCAEKDKWFSQTELIKEESGRIAIAFYRQYRAQIGRLSMYRLVGEFRRQTPLPAFSPEDTEFMPSSLRVIGLINQTVPAVHF